MSRPSEAAVIQSVWVRFIQEFVADLRTTDFWCTMLPDDHNPHNAKMKHHVAPFNEGRIAMLLRGERRFGLCPILKGTDKIKTATMDLDSHKGETPWPVMMTLAAQIMELARERYGLEANPWRSAGGEGCHLIFRWREWQDAYTVRKILEEILAIIGFKPGAGGVHVKQIEIFPKQDRVADDPEAWGSMTWLPLSDASVPIVDGVAEDRDTLDIGAYEWHFSAALELLIAPTPPKVEGEAEKRSTDLLQQVQSALNAIPQKDVLRAPGRDAWMRVILGVHYVSRGSDEGYMMARKWAEDWGGGFNEHDFEGVWRHGKLDRDKPCTEKTVFMVAYEYGWGGSDQRKAGRATLELFVNLDLDPEFEVAPEHQEKPESRDGIPQIRDETPEKRNETGFPEFPEGASPALQSALAKQWRNQMNAQYGYMDAFTVEEEAALQQMEDEAFEREEEAALAAEEAQGPPPNRKDPQIVEFPEAFRGPMKELYDAGMASASRVQPALMGLGILVGMASCIDSRYHFEGSDDRLNLYGLGVAESTAGKQRPQRLAQQLVQTFYPRMVLVGDIGSKEGLEDAFVTRNTHDNSRPDRLPVLSTQAEMAHYLQGMEENKDPIKVGLGKMMLEYFNMSDGDLLLRLLADGPRRAQRANRPAIHNPCFNMLGFSTPEKLGGSLTLDSIASGLAGRMLMVRGLTHPQWIYRKDKRPFEMPELVLERLRRLRAARVPFGEEGEAQSESGVVIINEDLNNPQWTIQISEEVAALCDEIEKAFEELSNKAATMQERVLAGRAMEILMRVAGVLAVWDCPEAPVLTCEHLTWARRALAHSHSAALSFFSNYSGASNEERAMAAIVRLLKHAKEDVKLRERGEKTNLKMPDIKKRPKDKADYAAMQVGALTYAYLRRSVRVQDQDFKRALSSLVDMEDIGTVEVLSYLSEEGERVPLRKVGKPAYRYTGKK